MSRNFTINIICPACGEENEIDVYFEGATSPYPTSNPDHPGYADLGSAGYAETEDLCGNAACRYDFGRSDFEGELYNACEKELQARYEDALEARAEARRDRDREGWD